MSLLPPGEHDHVVRLDDGPHDTLVLERDLSSVARSRTWLADFLTRTRATSNVRDDATLVVSELVTNALRYGLGHVVVRARLADDGEVRVVVSDAGGGGAPEVQPVDPHRVGGVGLRIVEQVAADWGVARFPGGTTVWATVRPTSG